MSAYLHICDAVCVCACVRVCVHVGCTHTLHPFGLFSRTYELCKHHPSKWFMCLILILILIAACGLTMARAAVLAYQALMNVYACVCMRALASVRVCACIRVSACARP